MAPAACANGCEGIGTPARNEQPPIPAPNLEPTGEAKPPAPSGTPVQPVVLDVVVPSKVGDFTSRTDSYPRQVPLPNGGKLVSTRREYRLGDQRLKLEVTDTIHAPAVRAVVARAAGKQRTDGRNDFKGSQIGGHPAVVQWSSDSDLAMANVLVKERFLLNLQLTPAEGVADIERLAAQLPFDEVLRLERAYRARRGADAGKDLGPGADQGAQ